MFSLKRTVLWFAVGIFMFLSCSRRDKIPPGILDQGQMVNVLAEIYMMEQRVGGLGVKRDSIKQVFKVMTDTIFAAANVNDSIFKRSMNYYMDRPKELDIIYGALIDSLNLREQRAVAEGKTK